MTFYPMHANHMPTEKPMIYAIRYEDKWVLIANDTGVFPEEDWKFLEEKKFRFDLVISDCTGGLLDYRDGHMSGKFETASGSSGLCRRQNAIRHQPFFP